METKQFTDRLATLYILAAPCGPPNLLENLPSMTRRWQSCHAGTPLKQCTWSWGRRPRRPHHTCAPAAQPPGFSRPHPIPELLAYVHSGGDKNRHRTGYVTTEVSSDRLKHTNMWRLGKRCLDCVFTTRLEVRPQFLRLFKAQVETDNVRSICRCLKESIRSPLL